MRRALCFIRILGLWVVAGIATLWLSLMKVGTWNYAAIGASNAYDESDVTVYSIWDGALFKSLPDRVSVRFSGKNSRIGWFRYRPATGRVYEWPEDGGPDWRELGALNTDVIAERVAIAMPDRDEAYRRALAEDVVKLVGLAASKQMFDLAWEDWDSLAANDGSLPPAEGWNVLRPRFGGQSPVTVRRSVDWTMLLIAAPGVVAIGGTVGLMRWGKSRRSA